MKVQTQRKYDTYYDPTFTVGDVKDIYRDVNRLNPPQIERVPNFENLFSESRIHPSHSYRIKYDNRLAPLPPQTFLKSGKSENVEYISGTDRMKYFKRPVMQILDESTPVVQTKQVISSTMEKLPQSKQTLKKLSHLQLPKSRTVGTQSIYRESEAQTHPYTPDFTIPKGEDPEVIQLLPLKYNDGLPASEETMQFIDQRRRRRQVEESLPQGTDKEAFAERLRRLNELEMLEWKERDEKITRERNELVELIRKQAFEREAEIEQKHRDEIEELKRKKSEMIQKKIETLNFKRRKQHRKILKKYDNPENTVKRRDIIEEYAFFGSRTYAPLMREGRIADKNPIGYEIRPLLLTDPLGIEEISRKHLKKLTETKLPDQTVKLNRREEKIQLNIQYAKELLTKKEKTEEFDVYQLYRATPRLVRPKTPVLEIEEDDELINAVVMIQKLLRGRAAQNAYMEGKERSLELIKELQGVQDVIEAEKKREISKAELEAIEKKEEDKLKVRLIDHIIGRISSQTLDYLAKELIRLEELRKIEQYAAIAELERRKREAEELGRRQREEELRTKQEEIFYNIIKTNDKTIQTYIDDVFIETIESLSYKKALEHIIHREQEFNVKDLVTQFLLPQVERQIIKDKVLKTQQEYLNVAHNVVNEVVKNIK